MTDLIRSGVTQAAVRAYRGGWLADCRCNAAGYVPRWAPVFDCAECGATTELVWPSPQMLAGVERLLGMRPGRDHRNWQPGETLNDLMWENGAHGIFDGLDPVGVGSGPLLVVEDDRVLVDALPALTGNNQRTVSA